MVLSHGLGDGFQGKAAAAYQRFSSFFHEKTHRSKSEGGRGKAAGEAGT